MTVEAPPVDFNPARAARLGIWTGARRHTDGIQVGERTGPIVHYHLSTNVMPGRYVPALRMLKPRRAFATLHDPYDDPPPGSPAARRWAAAAPHLFDRVISGSQLGVERQIQYGLPASLVQCIFNGVNIERFGGGRGERARAQLGLDETTPLVVVSSRLAPQKRPLDALAAFARVAADMPDAHLVFVGEGVLLGTVRDEIARLRLGHRVHLAGQQFNVPDWLDAATAWLLPTESETSAWRSSRRWRQAARSSARSVRAMRRCSSPATTRCSPPLAMSTTRPTRLAASSGMPI
jgi:glycosyltransferase involved in cell wall biosynthesis